MEQKQKRKEIDTTYYVVTLWNMRENVQLLIFSPGNTNDATKVFKYLTFFGETPDSPKSLVFLPLKVKISPF